MNLYYFTLKKKNLILIVLLPLLFACNDDETKGLSFYTDKAIQIDGHKENQWKKSNIFNAVSEVCGNEWDGKKDFSLSWRSLWDNEKIYFFFEVIDDKLVKNKTDMVPFWENDMLEVFFTQRKRLKSPSNAHFTFCFDVDSVITNVKGGPKSIKYMRKISDNGYILEIGIPWEEIGVNPSTKKSIFFNIEASDCDKIAEDEGVFYGREAVISWSRGSCNNSVRASNTFGTLYLKD